MPTRPRCRWPYPFLPLCRARGGSCVASVRWPAFVVGVIPARQTAVGAGVEAPLHLAGRPPIVVGRRAHDMPLVLSHTTGARGLWSRELSRALSIGLRCRHARRTVTSKRHRDSSWGRAPSCIRCSCTSSSWTGRASPRRAPGRSRPVGRAGPVRVGQSEKVPESPGAFPRRQHGNSTVGPGEGSWASSRSQTGAETSGSINPCWASCERSDGTMRSFFGGRRDPLPATAGTERMGLVFDVLSAS